MRLGRHAQGSKGQRKKPEAKSRTRSPGDGNAKARGSRKEFCDRGHGVFRYELIKRLLARRERLVPSLPDALPV